MVEVGKAGTVPAFRACAKVATKAGPIPIVIYSFGESEASAQIALSDFSNLKQAFWSPHAIVSFSPSKERTAARMQVKRIAASFSMASDCLIVILDGIDIMLPSFHLLLH